MKLKIEMSLELSRLMSRTSIKVSGDGCVIVMINVIMVTVKFGQ